MTRLEAALYALTHTGTPGDVEFYRRACRGARSVLELGCGSGRLLAKLVAPGRRVVGLELDRDLLSLARRAAPRGVELVRGDMSTFELGARFDRILIPFSGLYCLLTRAAVQRCLRRVQRHLAPGGLLAFDAYAADAFHHDASPGDVEDDELSTVVSFEHAGKRWDVYERSRWAKARQRLDVTYVYAARASRKRVEVAIPQRYLLSEQVGPLLAGAGLRLETLSDGFRGGRFRPQHAERLVVTARRALD